MQFQLLGINLAFFHTYVFLSVPFCISNSICLIYFNVIPHKMFFFLTTKGTSLLPSDKLL